MKDGAVSPDERRELEALRRRVSELEGLVERLKRAEQTARQSQTRYRDLADSKLRSEVADHKRTEEALKQVDSRMRSLLSSMVDFVFVFDTEGRFVFFNLPPNTNGLYASPERFIGRKHAEVMPPHMNELFAQAMERNRQGLDARYDYALDLPQGRRWFSVELSPITVDGQFTGSVAVVRDITDRKQAEESLRLAHLALVNAREEERRRLARELHDSIGQRLIAARLKLVDLIGRDPPAAGASPPEAMSALSSELEELIGDVRRISHGLYPATLAQCGLGSAMKQLAGAWPPCEVDVSLRCAAAVRDARFPEAVEIAFFRIAQEAVTNAVRHGKPGHVKMKLGHSKGQLRLAVVDDGHGFDIRQGAADGLGLTSMRERSEAIGGALQITSRPGRTCVEVRVAAPKRSDA